MNWFAWPFGAEKNINNFISNVKTTSAIAVCGLVISGCVSSETLEISESSSTNADGVVKTAGAENAAPASGATVSGAKTANAANEEDERPAALAEHISAQSGQQQLVQLDDGKTISIPSPRQYATNAELVNPQKSNPNDELKVASIPADTANSTGTAIPLTAASATNVVATPSSSNRTTLALAPVSETKVADTSSASADAAEKQATASLNEPLKKGGFLANFFRRPKANVGANDDRNNPILASTRSTSYTKKVGLPGVKNNDELFGTSKTKKSNIKLASVGGMGRFSPLDIKTQHSGVEVGCIRPNLVRMIKYIENHYGRPAVVTSGYRSPSRNRRAGGAKNSMHMYCKAVDVQVKGVSKWKLAKFMRTIPGRGGVGTYCRTKSVHLDVGPKRDWHYSCRRKSKRRKRRA